MVDVREFMSHLPAVLHQQGLELIPVTLEVCSMPARLSFARGIYGYLSAGCQKRNREAPAVLGHLNQKKVLYPAEVLPTAGGRLRAVAGHVRGAQVHPRPAAVARLRATVPPGRACCTLVHPSHAVCTVTL